MALAPVWFLLASGVVGAAFVAAGTDLSQLDAIMADHVPTIVLVAELLMVLPVFMTGGLRGVPAALRETPMRGGVLGAGVGVVIAVLYMTVLSPAHEWLQRTLGDYVPAGATTSSLASQTLVLFVANVLLAPVVEEVTYRQVGWVGLSSRYSPMVAGVLTTVMFGLLHWMGGGWYIALTAIFAGVPLVLLRSRLGLGAAIACHLSLNLLEFSWLVLR
jgi:hypothetical protein